MIDISPTRAFNQYMRFDLCYKAGHILVKSTAEVVMAQIRALTLESQRRVVSPAALQTSGEIYEGCYRGIPSRK